ncbi:MAG: LssY C-terminal domain-containing protein [Elusimicrobia bacterium]|nr:LssY C-terminal domain-containing protein [Elusimicrobiota bacterium]
MRKPLAAAGVLFLAALGGAFFSDLLFPLDPGTLSSRPVSRAEAASCLKLLAGRNEGRGGREGDPWNLAFWGTAEDVRHALALAGWTEVPLSLGKSLRAGTAELLSGSQLRRFPPFNLYRFLSRNQDMNWAVIDRPLVSRHHFRLWRTGFTDPEGRELWWGSGNRDLAIRWRDLSHRPDPDMDSERAFIASTLGRKVPGVKLSLVRLPQIPLSGENDKGYAFRTDGRVLLVELPVQGRAGPSDAPPTARDR